MDAATRPTVRNVALVGHAGSGKTTLAEALLLRAGAVPRAGRVEDGSTVCDHEPEEVARGSSVALGVADLDWTCSQGSPHRITLMDTPGSPDFAGAVDAALAVADLAVVVVSAVDGVQSGTEAAWRRCDEAGIPRLVVVSQEDRARADFHRVLDQVRDLAARTGHDPAAVLPLELPLGEEQALHGVADVLSDRGLDYGADGRHRDCDLPADVADEEHRLHGEVTEEIVAHDDDQLEQYLSGEEPGPADLERTLAREVASGGAVPVLVASAATGVGIDRLADLVCEIGPAPTDRPARLRVGGGGPEDGAETDLPADPDAETVLHVFRTVADPFVGQVSVFKVLSGTVRSGDRLVSTTTGAEERLHGLFRLRGREHLPVDAVAAGGIAAVAKLGSAPTGTLLVPAGSAAPDGSSRRSAGRVATTSVTPGQSASTIWCSASANGRYGRPISPRSTQWLMTTVAPRSVASRAVCVSSRVLPTPASAPSSTRPGSPVAARATAASSAATSSSRATKGARATDRLMGSIVAASTDTRPPRSAVGGSAVPAAPPPAQVGPAHGGADDLLAVGHLGVERRAPDGVHVRLPCGASPLRWSGWRAGPLPAGTTLVLRPGAPDRSTDHSAGPVGAGPRLRWH